MENQAIETSTQDQEVSKDQVIEKPVPSWAKGQIKIQPNNEQHNLDLKNGIKEASKTYENKDKKELTPNVNQEQKRDNKTSPPVPEKDIKSSNWTITDDGIKFHYKVNGSEYEKNYTYDQIHRNSQKWEGADKRMQEAVNLVRQNQKLIETINGVKEKKDLKKFFNLIGVDNDRELLENYLWENYVKLENMDEKDRELHLTKKQMEELQAKEAERQRIDQEEMLKRETDNYRNKFQGEIIETMKRNTDLPQNEWTVSQIAYYMREFMRIGMDKTPDEVIPLVKEDYESMVKRAVSTSSIESVVKYLGDDGVEKLREHIVNKFKKEPQSNVAPKLENNLSTTNGERRYMSIDEFKERNKRILANRGSLE